MVGGGGLIALRDSCVPEVVPALALPDGANISWHHGQFQKIGKFLVYCLLLI